MRNNTQTISFDSHRLSSVAIRSAKLGLVRRIRRSLGGAVAYLASWWRY